MLITIVFVKHAIIFQSKVVLSKPNNTKIHSFLSDFKDFNNPNLKLHPYKILNTRKSRHSHRVHNQTEKKFKSRATTSETPPFSHTKTSLLTTCIYTTFLTILCRRALHHTARAPSRNTHSAVSAAAAPPPLSQSRTERSARRNSPPGPLAFRRAARSVVIHSSKTARKE